MLPKGIILLILLMWGSGLIAQEQLLQRKVSFSKQQGYVQDLLEDLSEQGKVNLSYSQNHLPKAQIINLTSKELSVGDALDLILKDTGLTYIVRRDLIIIKKKPTRRRTRRYTISGSIKEASSGEALIGAQVALADQLLGTNANAYGFYSLSLPAGSYTLNYSYLGFKSSLKEVSLNKNQRVDVELEDSLLLLNELEILAEPDKNVTSTEMGTHQLTSNSLTDIPFLFGEKDLVSSIRLLPGVTTVGDGASGFNVRGGGIDQNLLLLDEAPVYNSAHYYGLFSVFNPDAIKNVKLYKAGIPAAYGGGLSSVFDVKQKEGNNKKFKMSGGLGVPAVRLTLEGPLIKDRTSYLLAFRSTFVDLSSLGLGSFQNNDAGFIDFNAKLNHTINDKNHIYFSTYLGNDTNQFIDSDANLQWGNTTATLRWNRIFSQRMFANFTGVYSRYEFSLSQPTAINVIETNSALTDYHLKGDFSYYINPKLQLDFGVNGIFHDFKPGTFRTVSEINPARIVTLKRERGIEAALYASANHQLNPKLKAVYGLRYSRFHNIGPREVFTYQPGVPRSLERVIDTLNFSGGQTVKSYQSLEPRILLNFELGAKSALKFNYSYAKQYTHLISNSTAALLTDLWKLSDTHIQPQSGHQVSLGYYKNFSDQFEFSVESYYRKMNHLIEYRDGADLVLNPNLETELIPAEGRSYGIEFFLKKRSGDFTGWLAYTLSRAERRTTSSNPEDQINEGRYFRANFHRSHDFKIVGSHRLNKRWKVSADFVYSSGRPISLPDGKFDFEGIQVPIYSDRNMQRLPAYHRLDISAQLLGKNKKKKRWRGSWVFAIYNVYARTNPISLVFLQNDNTPEVQLEELSSIGFLIPSVTYNFQF